MHWSTLGKERKVLLRLIVDQMPLQDSYLAGETALALIVEHRESIDFDWFSPSEFDPESLARQLSRLKPFTVNEATRGTLHGIIDNVRISCPALPLQFSSLRACYLGVCRLPHPAAARHCGSEAAQ